MHAPSPSIVLHSSLRCLHMVTGSIRSFLPATVHTVCKKEHEGGQSLWWRWW